MDWKYILSLNTEDLKDEDKDELYNAVAWFDLEKEAVDSVKLKSLLRVSQEILKYKGEQVETLLHELEEMAIKQGEEEARRQESDSEHKSGMPSGKSSLEYENLEQKYLELRAKQKKLIKNNEKRELEISKLSNKVKLLEQENRRLQNELQSRPHEIGSESDISETTREQQNQLVESLHNKNKHISDLLRDVEDVEKENFILREKISKVKDELSVATKEMTNLTETLDSKEKVFKEYSDKLGKMEKENEDLRKNIDEVQKIKNQLEQDFKERTVEMESAIKALENEKKRKDDEIQHLKSIYKEPSVNSSISSLPKDDPEQSHISALQRALADREKQLQEVRGQLQVATREMEECAELLKGMKRGEEIDKRKIGEMEKNIVEMKKLLSTAHERSQTLQEELAFVEENVRSKEAELKEIHSKMKENGQVELVVNLEEIQELKFQNRTKQKHIISLVKTANKLQDSCDKFEKENYALRDQLGLAQEDEVNLVGFTTKMKKMKREMNALKENLAKREEQSLQLKTDNHKLNQTIFSLANQLLELGHKPVYEMNGGDVSKNHNLVNENKALVEENEALRKGMHEILNSINAKKSASVNEIKSETFEKLLRALDVKHISGWYHPAMRLQAEIHHLQGVNSELRDQLRLAKTEAQKVIAEASSNKKTEERSVESTEENTDKQVVDAKDESLDFVCPDDLRADNVEMKLNEILKKGAISKESSGSADATRKILLAWFRNILAENSEAKQKLQTTEEALKDLETEHQVLLEKLKILLGETDEDKATKIDEVVRKNVSMKRQLAYLENEVKRLENKLEEVREGAENTATNNTRSIGDLERKTKSLEINLTIARNLSDISVDSETHKEVAKNLHNMTIKYRELADFVKRKEEEQSLEKSLLLETQKNLESNRLELKDKLTATLSKLALQSVQTKDDRLQSLSQKLAESEVNEMTERQRANHTSNLYDLVREQLNKSEEKFQELARHNEDLLKKNLVLQEQLKELESRVCDDVDIVLYNKLQKTNNDLLMENERLSTFVAKSEEDLELLRRKKEHQLSWNDAKEQELLNLKHRVVDLISSSDEKVTIAQLNGDVFQYRQSHNYYKAKWEESSKELSELKKKYDVETSDREKQRTFSEEKLVSFKKTMVNVRRLFDSLKLQYLGCVPLCSEQIFVNNVKKINEERHQSFVSLHKAKLMECEAALLKEQLKVELDRLKEERKRVGDEDGGEQSNQVMNWVKEKKAFQINELRYKRQSEFKEAQLQHYLERIKMQDDQIARLDEELLMWHKNFDNISAQKEDDVVIIKVPETITTADPTPEVSLPAISNLFRSVDCQTSVEPAPDTPKEDQNLSTLVADLSEAKDRLSAREEAVNQLKSKVAEQEMTISLFRKQIGDKQSQITFYERHIMELQQQQQVKKAEIHVSGAGGDNVNARVERTDSNKEILGLAATVKTLQDSLRTKDEDIVKYQTLLKVDRDKHSLAAATLQEELKNIQRMLAEEKQKSFSLEQNLSECRPNKAAMAQYMSQVHALEKHTSELHTKVSSLEAQLQSTREEVVRWRTLANDRLSAMEELRKNLDSQHRNELEIYKIDTQKLKELGKDEANSLRQLISKQKTELTGRLDADVQRVVREKDDKIHELTIKLRQLKSQSLKKSEQPVLELSPKVSDLEASREQLMKENELLKRRYEQFIARERATKEEIRELRAQLSKKPNTARSDKSERSIKDQLQKKISAQENELLQLRESLAEQIAVNETHKVQANEDFDKWKKMKYWQQTAEKLKTKLAERDAEFEKLQQTTAGYRMLIERLEREKHNLENRVKNLKSAGANVPDYKELEMLRIDNMKLRADVEALNSKLEMQHHHSGGLGAAMMQEKLESQERKIAILEVAAKGTVEVRAEIERLQAANSSLQKANIKLEAENLDLKLDLEQCTKETPHLHQQIQHLENYVDVLKNERSHPELDNNVKQAAVPETQKVSELERTVFILKRVVEKLQVENKRLVSGKRPLSDRSASADKLKRDHLRLKEKYTECVQKLGTLEQELSAAKNKPKQFPATQKPADDKVVALSEELAKVREQLEQKSSLLDKVKILLHRAAAKEKSLLQEMAELRNQRCSGISPIPEESEGSSSSDL